MFVSGSFLRRALVACALMLVAGEAGAQMAPPVPVPGADEQKLNFVPGQYLIRRRPGVTREECLRDLSARIGGPVEVVQAYDEEGLLHVQVDLDAPRDAEASVYAAAQYEYGNTLAASTNVERVEPVVQYRLAQAPSDPEEVAEAFGSLLSRMQVSEAWKAHRATGEPLIVAVIDTGVLLEHEMFEGLLLPGYDVTRDIADGSAQRLPSGAIEDHGTRVAGMVAAMLRASPVDGPGPVPDIRILPIRTTRMSPDGTQQVVLTPDGIEAIDYAVSQGARVINLSWGEAVPSEELRAAIQRANDKGAVVIAAAGNGRAAGSTRVGYDIDAEPFYPASYALPNVIGVAALAQEGALAPWSNWGKTAVEVAAPGDGVMTAVPFFDATTQTIGSGYSISSGTSFAAPLVAGGAALLMAAHPNFKPHEIVSLMTRGVDPLAPLATQVASGGRIDVDQVLLTAAPAYAVVPPEQRPVAVVASGSEIATDNEKVPVDIRAYADTTTAGRPDTNAPVLPGSDVARPEPAAGNRIQVMVRFAWWRRPTSVLGHLTDAKAVDMERIGFFARNRYSVTFETSRSKEDLIAAIKDLNGVWNVEPVQAYPLQKPGD